MTELQVLYGIAMYGIGLIFRNPYNNSYLK